MSAPNNTIYALSNFQNVIFFTSLGSAPSPPPSTIPIGIYAADGSWNITVVSGSVYTGLYAADGSYNVVVSPGGSQVGAYAPCGAWYVTRAPASTLVGMRAPDGSLYVYTGAYTGSGQRVTVVSGVLP